MKTQPSGSLKRLASQPRIFSVIPLGKFSETARDSDFFPVFAHPPGISDDPTKLAERR
jgi:hypothetical protein